MAEKNEFSREEAIKRLTQMYDGYHFSPASPDVFNPFSLLNCFADNRLNAYWFGSGTPTYLIEMMKKFGVVPSFLGVNDADAADFDAATETMTTLTPLLYQSGYITIKSCIREFGLYNLDIPNKEVRVGLMRSLLPHYVTPNTVMASSTVGKMTLALYRDDLEEALRLLQTFLSTVPYVKVFVKPDAQRSEAYFQDLCHGEKTCAKANGVKTEGHWQQVLYIIFSLLGTNCDVEVHTATGRGDLVLVTRTRLYLIETKIGRSAAAIEQINLKEYDKRFALYPYPVVKAGLAFDTDSHTLTGWVIEEP